MNSPFDDAPLLRLVARDLIRAATRLEAGQRLSADDAEALVLGLRHAARKLDDPDPHGDAGPDLGPLDDRLARFWASYRSN